MYTELVENTYQFNSSIGLNADQIRLQALKSFKAVAHKYSDGIKVKKVGQWYVLHSNDYNAILGVMNKAKAVARTQTQDIKNGMSYGIPNCVTPIIDHEFFVTFGQDYKNKGTLKAVMRGVSRYAILIGQGVQNNFQEYINSQYHHTKTQAQKIKKWVNYRGV